MTDYTVTTDFSAKDALNTGDPEKIILGSDIDTEFDNIATAIATKKNSAYQGALVYNTSGTQSVGAATTATITFNAESYDTDSIHSTSTNTDRLTVPSGVTRVKIKGQAALGSLAADKYMTINIHKNGAGLTPTIKSWLSTPTGTSGTFYLQIESPTLTVTATDYFTMVVGNGDASSRDIVNADTWFAMEIIE